ncbi:hypothetical protein [Roseinatronobacter sp.]|uniref:hypothetical protein n=1 Tax=Roseinatronobacter sp. TaxID=1945755 RepID=UPI003F6E69DB
MPMTPAEKQRAYRERQAEKKKQEILVAPNLSGVFKVPFHQFWSDQPDLNMTFGYRLRVNSISPPDFNVGDVPSDEDDEDDPYFASEGSYRYAVEWFGHALSAMTVLAEGLNEYQRQEIKARLAEIEASDLSEPQAKKAALKEAARLNKMLDQLDKQVRHTFPQWKVTG